MRPAAADHGDGALGSTISALLPPFVYCGAEDVLLLLSSPFVVFLHVLLHLSDKHRSAPRQLPPFLELRLDGGILEEIDAKEATTSFSATFWLQNGAPRKIGNEERSRPFLLPFLLMER